MTRLRKWQMMNLDLIAGFIDGFKPVTRMKVSEWSDAHRHLSKIASARPGRYSTAFTPYLEEPMDNLSESSPISRTILAKSAQVGGTEIGLNWIGSIIHVAPAATLMVMPTDETVRRNSKIRIDPMIQASPELKKRIKPSRSRDSENTTVQKSFPGGVLIMCGANSGAGLRSMPIKNLMLDEVDAYPADLDGEGSPIELARARTITYSGKKKELTLSTPTTEELSVIWQEFQDSDQRHYHVPCPYCGILQTLEWSMVVWPDGQPENAKIKCKGCDELIEERHKMWMVSKSSGAHWIAANPDHVDKLKRGYHINALYSTLGYTWQDAIKQYLSAKGNDIKMKTFTNIVLGLPWKESLESPEWSTLYGRRSNYNLNTPPNAVSFLTMGVDVQRDRIELEVVGWCRNRVSYSIDYRVLAGDTSSKSNEVWKKLDLVINETFIREDGMMMPLRMVCVDSSAFSQVVYDFCKGYSPDKVIPIKGSDTIDTIVGFPKQVDIMKSGKPVGKTQLWRIGVSLVKTELYGWLKQTKVDGEDEPVGYCYFPQYGEDYFKMLVSEKKTITTNKAGYRKYEWVLPAHQRNEALDCRVYSRAAGYVVGMDRFTDERWEELRVQYQMPPTPEEVKAEQAKSEKAGKKNNFLGNKDSIW